MIKNPMSKAIVTINDTIQPVNDPINELISNLKTTTI